MNSITALVLTYNEEAYIEGCLEGLTWTDEIVVIDSCSQDRTRDICRNYTDKVFQREFDDFASQRNFGLDRIDTDWVLVVDADERVTPELRSEIEGIADSSPVEAYRIPRRNYFLGKWIKYCGWYPDYTLRLFKTAGNRYQGKVHEGVEIEGQVENLEHDLIHYTYRDLSHYLDKINHYTSLSAEEMYKNRKNRGFGYSLVRPILEFIKKYILKKGFLLGKQGLALSLLSSYYQFLKYLKLWERRHQEEWRDHQ